MSGGSGSLDVMGCMFLFKMLVTICSLLEVEQVVVDGAGVVVATGDVAVGMMVMTCGVISSTGVPYV